MGAERTRGRGSSAPPLPLSLAAETGFLLCMTSSKISLRKGTLGRRKYHARPQSVERDREFGGVTAAESGWRRDRRLRVANILTQAQRENEEGGCDEGPQEHVPEPAVGGHGRRLTEISPTRQVTPSEARVRESLPRVGRMRRNLGE